MLLFIGQSFYINFLTLAPFLNDSRMTQSGPGSNPTPLRQLPFKIEREKRNMTEFLFENHTCKRWLKSWHLKPILERDLSISKSFIVCKKYLLCQSWQLNSWIKYSCKHLGRVSTKYAAALYTKPSANHYCSSLLFLSLYQQWS